jgi:intracellular sulfur oxidation DsrE/DsrF family protein
MNRSSKIVIGVIASLGLGVAVVAFAQPRGMGPGMMMHGMHSGMAGGNHGPMMGNMQSDSATAADMRLSHDLVVNHDRIKRTVTNLPNGIKTVTESDDPQVAQGITAHVASMTQRLDDGREFNMFSSTIPVLFENRAKIKTEVVASARGVTVIQTSSDPKVVTALQAHAEEVSELAREGMVAMMRGAQANMAGMMPRGPGNRPSTQGPETPHVH